MASLPMINAGSNGATITVTYISTFYDKTITCTKGTTTYTKTTTSSGSTTFDVSEAGEWTITCNGVTTKVDVIFDFPAQFAPNGSTVTPTDDIQTWLKCANIFNSTYTTLAEVLNDSTTLLALLSSNNASDYLVRSISWTTPFGLVPEMTSNTTPSGNVSYSAEYTPSSYQAWKAFNTTEEKGWFARQTGFSTDDYIEYEFPIARIVKKATVTAKATGSGSNVFYFKIQGYNGSSWVDLCSEQTLNMGASTTPSPLYPINVTLSNTISTTKYRLVMTRNSGSMNGYGLKIQYYLTSEAQGLCDNSTAMTDIGANDYCANTLLADSTWCNAICNSTYFESVLNVKVPVMTSATTPSGEAFGDNIYSGYEPWKAFTGTTINYSDCCAFQLNSTAHLGYVFTNSVKVYKVMIQNRANYDDSIHSFKVQGSSSKTGTYTDMSSILNVSNTTREAKNYFVINNSNAYKSLRIEMVIGSDYNCVGNLQFWGR